MAFYGNAKVASHYKRLQRFFRRFEIDSVVIARLIRSPFSIPKPWVLTIDRTNWQFGKVQINILTLRQAQCIWEQTWVENWVAKWSTLGLKGKFEGLIEACKYENSESLYSLLFQKVALCNGEFKTALKMIKTPQQAANWVTLSTRAVSFGQLAYKTDKVKMVPLIVKSLESGHQGAGYLTDFIDPTVENVVSGNYPLGGFIWIYVNKSPDKPLNHLEKAFVRLILSEGGQNIVKEQGLIPLPADSIAEVF